MTWEEYLENNSGDIVGKEVYITDIRIADGGNKFIRKVPPTKVVIRPISELDGKKTIYYSNYYFLKMSGDKVLKQIVAPFDNTGYRHKSGTSVHVFENMEDCVEKFNSMVDEASEVYTKRIELLMEEKNNLLKLKI